MIFIDALGKDVFIFVDGLLGAYRSLSDTNNLVEYNELWLYSIL